MLGSGTVPATFGVARLTTLVTSILVSLSSGSNYVVSAYLPQLGARLHLTHTQLNVFAVAGNVGVYMTGPFLGKVVDAKGPRPLLVAAFIFLLSGYSGIRGLFDAGLGNAAELSKLRLVTLVMCSFLTGVGAHAGMASAMNTTAKTFPDHTRAIVVGLVMAGFGLSAFFFSSISHILFPGNTSDFLLVLSLGTALPMVLGFFFVRPIPLTSHGITSVEGRSSTNYQPLSASVDPDEFPRRMYRSSSSVPLLFHVEGDEDEETREPILQRTPQRHASHPHVPLLDSVELSPSTSFHTRNLSAMSFPPREPPTEKVVEGRGVDLYRWTLCTSIDFWIMCFTHSLLAGTGLMYINNVGSIAQALFAHGNPAYNEAESSTWQAAQVSVLSLMNCLGRVLIGIAADAAKSRMHVPRSFCLPLVAILFGTANLLLMVIDDVQHLWTASGLVGLAYGCWFGLLPTIAIEWFGLAHFSENWGWISIFPVLGGNILSIAFGRNLDAHEPPPDSNPMPSGVSRPTSAHQCLAGRECYVQSLSWNLWACAIAIGLSIWAGRRDWLHWQRRSFGEQKDIVGWETAGEAIGSEDVDS